MSSISSCPNCHHPVSDDICENCGAILSTLVMAPVRVASTSISSATSSSSSPPAGKPVCPTCKQPVEPDADICEQCGMVLTAMTLPPVAAVSTTITPLSISPPTVQDELCPRCRTRRAPGVKFCGRCGYNYVGAGATSASTSSAMQADPTPVQQLQIGGLLHNKYRVVKEIGAGGMGAVYLADDTVLKRQVVIKALLSSSDPDLVEQSVKEREFLAAIKHANIVSIYDFITVGNDGYIVMEYVKGKTLEQVMEERGGALGVEEAIRYILDILPAFSYMAKLGLVYCDFKPQNVMIETLKDGTDVVKLIDLGTVIKYEAAPKDVYGTHGFYAPEAVKSPSPQTDLYAICRTLAYMVTQMDLANPIFGMPSSEYYKTFREHRALYRLLVKGTHSQPSQRFQSAEELIDQLMGVRRQIVGGRPSEPVGSKLFVPGILTTTGKLGLRAEAMLDESDKAIDLLRYGDQALRSSNYARAKSFYDQALKANPLSVDAHMRLAEVYIDQAEYSSALAEVTKVQRMNPGNWKIAWYTGRLLEAQEKYPEAVDQYRELMADLPGELPPMQALARVYVRLQQDVDAFDLYTQVLKADPGNVEAILGATNALLNQNRWDEAAQLLNSVNESAARFVEAQLLLIDLYLNRMSPLIPQNVQHAAEAMQALSGRTEDARYYLARGDIYRAAWQMARKKQLASTITIAGVPNTRAKTLGRAAEESYQQYLRREAHPTNREAIVRRKLAVAPWRWL
jgi:serine/threonine-protein kinase PknG